MNGSIIIRLDGGMRSALDWSKGREAAQNYVKEGLKLLWEIDLGLAGQLHYPIGNAMQHQALGLALDHFRDTLWSEFCQSSLGLVLYRGSADYAPYFPWDEQQRANFEQWRQGRCDEEGRQKQLFCCNVAVDYLQLLAMRLPDALPLFVILDCSGVTDLLSLSQLLSRERYAPFNLTLENCPFAETNEPANAPKVAVVLPSEQSNFPELRLVMEKLQRSQVPFRIIPEPFLTTEWDGLDSLYYSERALTPQGRRMLQGFVAAGGTIFQLN